MDKGKVVDLFTRRRLDKSDQDTKANDQRAEQKGVYIGHIHKDIADRIIAMKAHVEGIEEQIENLMEKWEHLSIDYTKSVQHILHILDKPGLNMLTHELSISEDGHIWIVPLDD